MAQQIDLTFKQGSVIAAGENEKITQLGFFVMDPRTGEWRAKACDYREVVLNLIDLKLPYEDRARGYETLNLHYKKPLTPRPHQRDALEAWKKNGSRGVISLPTGSGKTMIAVMAIAMVHRATLVVVPTIDLLHQWRDVLESYLDVPVQLLGGGNKGLGSITVSTYDSARMVIEEAGDRFGLIVFDECHHLPAPHYQFIAIAALAPYRLGLSATVERADGKESVIYDLLGPLVYEGKVTDLVSKSLAPYDVVSLEVPLTKDEQEAYARNRELYLNFIFRSGLNFSERGSWNRFLFLSTRSQEGRNALLAYREQKRIAQRAVRKFDCLWDLLTTHTQDQMLIFTDDNEMAYKIGCQFVLPVLTHRTKDKERKKFLSAFRNGEIKVLVTSKVLNEGVDVPDASVGVIVSGSSAVREHVQRLGRILRQKPDKRAVLYEILAKGTNEIDVNKRRRRHDAYEGTR
ncbi:MAG: DEAD/DEAH box helicase [Deltaproteobacteria bacterium]|nr:DEAD/DEAH box helicase [Deltaproteobacteria bacterium]